MKHYPPNAMGIPHTPDLIAARENAIALLAIYKQNAIQRRDLHQAAHWDAQIAFLKKGRDRDPPQLQPSPSLSRMVAKTHILERT